MVKNTETSAHIGIVGRYEIVNLDAIKTTNFTKIHLCFLYISPKKIKI